jgi:hypothetical protein
MTSGSLLYLLMCIAAFVIFAAALAYTSWQQGKMGRETTPAPVDVPQVSDPVTG